MGAWCIAAVLVGGLAERKSRHVRVGGIAETIDATVSSQFAGTVQSLSVDLLDQVEEGAVVAVMDDGLVKASFVTAQAELSRLRAELRAKKRGARLETTAGARRFVLNEEAARLDFMDRLIELETDKIELERRRLEVARLERLVREGLIDRSAYDSERLRYKALAARVEQSAETMELSRRRREESVERRLEYERQTTDSGLVDYLAPLRESVRVQEAKLQEILEHRTLLVLRAPIAGRVTQVFARDGMTVAGGEPILAMSSSRTSRVLTFVEERSIGRVRIGESVEIYSPHRARVVVHARVLKLGSRVEEVPLQLQRNALFPRWGVPVLLGGVPTDAFMPGEALEVQFLGVAEPATHDDMTPSPNIGRSLP